MKNQMPAADAAKLISYLNVEVRKYQASKSENMKSWRARQMDKLEQQLCDGYRTWTGGWVAQNASLSDAQRTYEVYVLQPTEEEKTQRTAKLDEWKREAMHEELAQAKRDYAEKLREAIRDMEKELFRVENDSVSLSEGTYRYSGAMDLPILNERVIRLSKLVRYVDTGDYSRW